MIHPVTIYLHRYLHSRPVLASFLGGLPALVLDLGGVRGPITPPGPGQTLSDLSDSMNNGNPDQNIDDKRIGGPRIDMF